MIAALAVRTGSLPDEWARQDPADIVTVLSIFEQQDQEARKKR